MLDESRQSELHNEPLDSFVETTEVQNDVYEVRDQRLHFVQQKFCSDCKGLYTLSRSAMRSD